MGDTLNKVHRGTGRTLMAEPRAAAKVAQVDLSRPIERSPRWHWAAIQCLGNLVEYSRSRAEAGRRSRVESDADCNSNCGTQVVNRADQIKRMLESEEDNIANHWGRYPSQHICRVFMFGCSPWILCENDVRVRLCLVPSQSGFRT